MTCWVLRRNQKHEKLISTTTMIMPWQPMKSDQKSCFMFWVWLIKAVNLKVYIQSTCFRCIQSYLKIKLSWIIKTIYIHWNGTHLMCYVRNVLREQPSFPESQCHSSPPSSPRPGTSGQTVDSEIRQGVDLQLNI